MQPEPPWWGTVVTSTTATMAMTTAPNRAPQRTRFARESRIVTMVRHGLASN